MMDCYCEGFIEYYTYYFILSILPLLSVFCYLLLLLIFIDIDIDIYFVLFYFVLFYYFVYFVYFV